VTTGRVIVQIRDFVSSIKSVDETVEGFCNEMESLKIVLEALNNVEPGFKQNDKFTQHWASVDRIVSDCQTTVGKLDMLLRRLGKKSDNTYQAIVKQLRLSSKTDDISNLRRQITWYNEALQTCLLSIHM